MSENGKNPAQSHFNDEEKQIIDNITINLAIVLDNVIIHYKNPKALMGAYTKMSSSSKNLERIAMRLNLQNISPEQGMFSEEMNKEIARILSKDYEKDYRLDPSKLSRLSKLRKELRTEGILYNIEGKKNIKSQSPKAISRKPKAGPARGEGRPILNKLWKTVDEYRKILSNPEALDIINKKLVNHGILEKAYNVVLKNGFQLFKEGDGREPYGFLQTFKELFPEVDLNAIPDPKLFQQRFNSNKEEVLEKYREELLGYLLENPRHGIFFIFNLAGLVDGG